MAPIRVAMIDDLARPGHKDVFPRTKYACKDLSLAWV